MGTSPPTHYLSAAERPVLDRLTSCKPPVSVRNRSGAEIEHQHTVRSTVVSSIASMWSGLGKLASNELLDIRSGSVWLTNQLRAW